MNQAQSIRERSMALNRGMAIGPLAALALLAIGLWNLGAPGMWWDEGWTLSVARNWVERGHYGRLLDGQLAPPGLEASLVVTAPIALSMRLFGVGIWQGRLFGVLCMLVAFALLSGSVAVWQLMPWLQAGLLQGHTLRPRPLVGLLDVTAFVPLWVARAR